MKKDKTFRPDRVLSYFKAEWLPLTFVTLSGLVYNIGLLATPWFEGRLAQCLADILGGSETAAKMAMLVLAYIVVTLAVQAARFGGVEGVHTNSMMNSAMLREYCRLDAASAALLERAMERLSLSARAYDRILKVARTIADLAGRRDIVPADVAEAINYRSLDRGNWGR